MIPLVKLLLAHFIGDFVLQPKSWVAEKEKHKIRSIKLYAHILLQGILIVVVFWDGSFWLLALMLMVVHALIDLLKLYFQKESNKSIWFLGDQLLHLISILIFWFWWFSPPFTFIQGLEDKMVWIYITALLFLTLVSGVMIQVFMAEWSAALQDGNEASLNNAGKYIGILERLFVFTFVVTGNWEAIGFLLAAKSVFRFGDLKESKDRKLTEYILIGTLLSFGIAIATGILVLAVQE